MDDHLLKLSGDDAWAFRRQIADATPCPLAKAAVEAGRAILRDIERDGFAIVAASPKGRRHD